MGLSSPPSLLVHLASLVGGDALCRWIGTSIELLAQKIIIIIIYWILAKKTSIELLAKNK